MGPHVSIEAHAWRSGFMGHDDCCRRSRDCKLDRCGPQGCRVESAKKASVLQTASFASAALFWPQLPTAGSYRAC